MNSDGKIYDQNSNEIKIDIELPREDLVNEAKRFLENPKVLGSSENVKRAFLSKKGLTKEEINLAFDQAKPNVSLVGNTGQNLAKVEHPQLGFWPRFRDLLNFAVLVGGALYGLKYLYEKFIGKWLYGSSVETKKKSLYEISTEIKTSLNELTNSIEKLQVSLSEQSDLGQKCFQEQSKRSFKDIQMDIQSLKGLLLNSHRFPSNPSIQISPSLPSWQIVATTTTSIPTTTTTTFSTRKEVEKVETSVESGSVSTTSPDLIVQKQQQQQQQQQQQRKSSSECEGETIEVKSVLSDSNGSSSTGSSTEIV